MDAEFILVSINTKNTMKQQEVADIAIFPMSTQGGQFWPKCKGGNL